MSIYPRYIEGRKVYLRPLVDSDFNDCFFLWMNDPEVNRYSQRASAPYEYDSLKSYWEYYKENSHKGIVLAIIANDRDVHIGNISLVDLHPVNRTADLAIVIGDTSYWNAGYGKECMYLMTKHAFYAMNLNKVIAGTCNPGFSRCVKALGWRNEGVFKERIWLGNEYHDQFWWSILKKDFVELKQYEQ